MLIRLFAVIISSIVFGIVLSYHFNSLSEALYFALGVISPVYFLFAVPISIWVDNLNRRMKFSSLVQCYFAKLGLYSLAGTLVGLIFYVLYGGFSYFSLDILGYFTRYGVTASILFYHILITLNKVKNYFYIRI